MKPQDDKILTELKEAVGPVLDQIEKELDSDHAAFVIGAKELKEDGEYSGIQTFLDVCGDYGIIGEALYTEMMDGIANGKPDLFNLMREVVKTVEKELEIKSDEPFLPTEQQTLH